MAPLCRDPSPAPDLSGRANRLSLAAGLIVGIAYSTFASFVANALTPVSSRLIELDSLRRAIPGHYQEVLNLDGVVSTVVGSMLVFAIVWWMMRVTLEYWDRADWLRINPVDRSLLDGSFLKPAEQGLSVSERE